MSEQNIKCILACWFHLTDYTSATKDTDEGQSRRMLINLAKNGITELPDDFLWCLDDITDLKASFNPLNTVCGAFNPEVICRNR